MKNITIYSIMLITLLGLGACGSHDPSQVVPLTPEKRTIVTAEAEYEANPVVSPDGQWVYFESDSDGDMDLFRIPFSGGTAQKLTSNSVFDSSPSLSPDGGKLVFESDLSEDRHLYILDLEHLESPPVALTTGSGDDGSPAWSPSGNFIAFESNRDKNTGTDLYLVDPLDGTVQRLTVTPENVICRTADWSPTGTSLVYESNTSGSSALYTIELTAIKGIQITPDSGYEGHPAWSPLGGEIAFESTRSGASQIYLVSPQGGEWTQLTVLGGYWPQWSPNAEAIVYGVFDDGNADVVSILVP